LIIEIPFSAVIPPPPPPPDAPWTAFTALVASAVISPKFDATPAKSLFSMESLRFFNFCKILLSI
jgi:hypothetical protein